MDVKKIIEYKIDFPAHEVVALHTELRVLFQTKPELTKIFPNVAIFAKGLAQKLGIHDYDIKAVEKMEAGIVSRGIREALGIVDTIPAVVEPVAGASAPTPEPTPNTDTAPELLTDEELQSAEG